MNDCFICGISGEQTKLFHVVYGEGIVFACEKCSTSENLPILKKPTTFQLKESERQHTVYERLSRAAGINPKEHSLKNGQEQEELERKKRKEDLKKQEMTLKDLIERNLKTETSEKKIKKQELDLAENYNWIIMMSRRKKRLTQEQLADAIGESSVAIKMAEQGILPEDDFRLINKLEAFLNIRIKKNNFNAHKTDYSDYTNYSSPPIPSAVLPKKAPARIINFKPETVKNLTIADLKKMKDEREKRKDILSEEDKTEKRRINRMEGRRGNFINKV